MGSAIRAGLPVALLLGQGCVVWAAWCSAVDRCPPPPSLPAPLPLFAVQDFLESVYLYMYRLPWEELFQDQAWRDKMDKMQVRGVGGGGAWRHRKQVLSCPVLSCIWV